MEGIVLDPEVTGLDQYLDWRNWPLTPSLPADTHTPPRPPRPPTPGLLEVDYGELVDTIDVQYFSDLFSGRPLARCSPKVPNFSLPTPWLKDNAVVLPGWNSLSKRPISGGSEQEQERPLKTARGNREAPLPFTAESNDDVVYSQTHADNGVINGSHFCTCRKAYASSYALKRHIEASGPPRYGCSECEKVFGRKDSLRRHNEVEHKGNRIACPGCQKDFRPDYLTKHLASGQRESCRVIAEALYIERYGLKLEAQPVADRFWIPSVANRVPHLTGGRAIWQDSPDWSHQLGQDVQGLAETMQLYQGVKMRPVLRDKREPCALCGLPLGTNEKELIDHIKHHSLELSTCTYRCADCQIDFSFAADLHLHREAAASGHCGFRFNHCRQGSDCCFGHHPPSGREQSYDDHDRMQAMVSTWQSCQLRRHRVAVAALQAELLLYGQYLRHSLRDAELDCMELLSRFSIESVDSFRSVPNWVQFEDKMKTEVSGSSLSPTISSPLTGSTPSPTLGLSCSPKSASPAGSSEGSRNTYMDQLRATRSPGGLKRKASGAFYRTKAATRYFSSELRLGEQSSRPHYVSAVAG